MKRALLILALSAAAPARGARTGAWLSSTNALPNARLPHVPLLGNGLFGLQVDSRNDTHSAVGAGGDSALDAFVSSNSFWSCGACAASAYAAGCCRVVALGGVSVSLRRAFPPPAAPLAFSAQQDLARGGLVRAALATPGGGSADFTLVLHPTLRVAVLNVSYSPKAGDPPSLDLDVSVWAPPPGPPPGEPHPQNTAGSSPAPMSAGCLAAGAPLGTPPSDCAAATRAPAAATLVAASRQASAGLANGSAPVVRPVWAALAAGLLGAESASFRVSSFNGTLQATASVSVRSGANAGLSIVIAEAEAQTNQTDPSAAAAALADSVLSAPNGGGVAAVETAAQEFWAAFWARSDVSLPALPDVEDLWHGAQFVLAATAAADPDAAPPGLFGVWTSSDETGWNGDMTLDCLFFLPFFLS